MGLGVDVFLLVWVLTFQTIRGARHVDSCFTGNAAGGRSKAYDTYKTDTHFKWIDDNQADIFKYIMFSQVYAFNLEQQQAVINSFYGVQDPYDYNECRQKRPVRAIDLSDGSHCLWLKAYNQTPRDIGR